MALRYGAAVAQAQRAGRPLVALESTVITHGMDYPDNLEVVGDMEQAIRDEGACPATIGIVDGCLTVGMTTGQIERFARADRGQIAKCSRRDLPVIMGLGRDGSLTVAGTMMIAQSAGIAIFATGGIGGVHRNHHFDVSADLLELGRTPVAVVCAGAKSILDLERTLEVLESQGVPVVGLGSINLPAFFARDSGLPLPASVDTLAELAQVFCAWRTLDAGNGLLITTPVPEPQAVARDEAEAAIEQAVAQADTEGIRGSALTPFVLERVAALTEGRSLIANRALLVNNARTAAALADHVAAVVD